ncbi:hypothetical protein OC846_005742 [Tilletia horrida]|uniref:Uncharacterized protein n=1 Tax=Tilletia horrida TaxID=155126 RepID=A0AAN6GK74_9BASI|nr:hypothetical protein OC845_006221 [Tilletia horrida]KAK0545260.1 hypothetical protein OC846_005742 [Tilletia horrida]KAK0561237.1 hypothetical protein OC861_005916 [Tilletia horrida]
MRAPILASALTTALLFLSGAQAGSVAARAPAPKCGPAQFTSSLYQLNEDTNARRNVSFQSAKDSLGRTMLSTSVNGVSAPATAKFEFVPCNSTVLPSARYESGANGYSYGVIRPVGQPTRCLTASSMTKNSTLRAFVNAPCATIDTVSKLAPQWFISHYYTFPTTGNKVEVDLNGDSNFTTTGYWIYNNVAAGNARLFETSWDQYGNASLPYRLFMSQTFKSG